MIRLLRDIAMALVTLTLFRGAVWALPYIGTDAVGLCAIGIVLLTIAAFLVLVKWAAE
jgi:hypothetical protein